MNWKDFFAGKKVTQMGLGLLGRGIQDAQFLSQYVAQLTITDLKNSEQLVEGVHRVKEVAPSDVVRFVLGQHVTEDFETADFILKGAGVPLRNAYIDAARARGVPVYMDESLFYMLAPAALQFIGITGTRGKTTTTMLLHHVVAHAYRSEKMNVYLAGNIRDVATLPLIESVTDSDIVVAELSSWQLQGFGDIKRSPRIAIFTNFYPDHLNYYDGDMEKYFNDKAQIFAHQTDEDMLIVSPQADVAIKQYYKGIIRSIYMVADTSSCASLLEHLVVPGEHNRENAALAIATARALQIPDTVISDALKTFTGAPGRLEYISNQAGVHVYNDATSTTPEALLVALRTVAEKQEAGTQLVLICGGADKKLDVTSLIEVLQTKRLVVITIPGTGTDILHALCDAHNIRYIAAEHLHAALEKSKELTKEGDSVLFSPGFASFGEFINEFDRYDQCTSYVKNIFNTMVE